MFYRRLALIASAAILTGWVAITLDQISGSAAVWSPDAGKRSLEAGAIEAESLAVIVNKQSPIPAEYVPDDLVVPGIPFTFNGDHEKRHLRKTAALAAEKLFAAAKKDGIFLYGVSGYRSYSTQRRLWDYNVKRKGAAEASRVNAYPGMSEHQTGLALDVTSKSAGFALTERFAETKEGKWLAENAHRFGFIIRYPQGKERITGYDYEPWHIRYVGLDAAEAIYKNGSTLEEWAGGAVPSGIFRFFRFNPF